MGYGLIKPFLEGKNFYSIVGFNAKTLGKDKACESNGAYQDTSSTCHTRIPFGGPIKGENLIILRSFPLFQFFLFHPEFPILRRRIVVKMLSMILEVEVINPSFLFPF
jgi:hypothetical protein